MIAPRKSPADGPVDQASQLHRVAACIVGDGGLALLLVAGAAAWNGVWAAAAFIAPLGLALLGAVAWAAWKTHRLGRS